ncbi:MAG TPA: catalase family peroxidase [Blastocatellia bacterium]|nr:catalase family peroxidase [Blastocatellia bacterium]
MPLPQDERIVSLANDLLQAFDKLFGVHPGFRPAHAKGELLSGTFTPAATARQLSRAPHLNGGPIRVEARFSNSTGIPAIPDNTAEANPRGFAIRFFMGEHVHTDIVSHSLDSFPTHTPAEFLEFLHAAAQSGPDVPSPKPIEKFLGSHPAALAFVTANQPFPSSLARETYFGVTALAFTNAAGETKFGRYRIIPELGNDYLPAEQVSSLSPNYHFDEIVERVTKSPIRFKIVVQVAAPTDITDDSTVHWPEDREQIELGTVELNRVVANNPAEQQHIIFDPIPRVDGIEPSADPLLDVRAALYLISGRRRRQAPNSAAAAS